MEFLTDPGLLTARAVLAGLIGICVGSFLNVVALRSLKEKSWIWPPSHCQQCEHALGLLDLIPIISFFLLKGRCKYCQKPVDWHYPLVELATGLAFVLVLYGYGISIEGLAMLIFACTLIATTITDFKEKIIPHDITYISMTLGIVYRSFFHFPLQPFKTQPLTFDPGLWSESLLNIGFHQDVFLDTMAGIGLSYIIFDFIAFYGLKMVLFLGGGEADSQESATETQETDPQIDGSFDLGAKTKTDEEEEELIVMGGADAVLAAVIAAWLGMGSMLISVLLAFLVGALMASAYLFVDMGKRGVLSSCIKPALIGFGLAATITALPLGWLMTMFGNTEGYISQFVTFVLVAGLCGAVLGAICHGSRFRHHFPFGPALACGAAIVMFQCCTRGSGAIPIPWGIITQGSMF